MSKEVEVEVEKVLSPAEKENREIINRYRRLLRSIRYTLNKEDKKLIRDAFDLALDAHKDVRRKSGEPYIFHPIEVARIAAKEIGLGPTSVACALIHDVVEDSDYSIEYIEKKFGKKVAVIIDGLTKISGVFDHTDSMQAENFRKMLLTLSKDVRVILIKLCDRLHNMRTLESMSRKNQLKIASETLFLYAPLAHRLGLYAIKTELEDLSIKYTEREKHSEISRKLKDSKASRDRYVRKFSEPIKKLLENQGLKYEIKGRVKSIFSILKKMDKQQITFDEVYDLFAIRIIIDSKPEYEKADCWKVYSLVTDVYYPNTARLRDWISQPKSNGYESLHTTVMGPEGLWVEVQIRTKRMDEVAEKGYAAHWKYKSAEDAKKVDSGLDGWLSRVKEVLEHPDQSALDFLDDFKNQLFSEEIFVFTPKGQLRKLSANATALDFAFDIHTQIGEKCIGAKVNNKLVQLSTKLENGDQVEILTSDKQKPREEWMSFVVTSKAKNSLKAYFNEDKRLHAEVGREILRKKFSKEKIVFNEDNLNRLVDFFKVRSVLDLCAAVGRGQIPKEKLEIKNSLSRKKRESAKNTETTTVTIPTVKEFKDQSVIVGETPELQYKLASCCNPIPGDDIFGFITVSDGIKIHRTNCPNGMALMSNYGYRVTKAEWRNHFSEGNKQFLAGIKIEGIDDVGIISSLADIISKAMKVNMKSITVESNGGTFEGTILLYIYDTKHLDEVRTKILNKHKHMKVTRITVAQDTV